MLAFHTTAAEFIQLLIDAELEYIYTDQKLLHYFLAYMTQ